MLRPLDSSEARQRAAELLSDHPEASLRDVAQAAGISPATVLDVRNRLKRGESPVPERSSPAPISKRATGHGVPGTPPGEGPAAERALPLALQGNPPSVAAVVEKLLRDPSLRNNERGKGILRLLQVNAVGAEQLSEVATTLPPHCVAIVLQLAHRYAKMWQDFAKELDCRAQIIYPSVHC